MNLSQRLTQPMLPRLTALSSLLFDDDWLDFALSKIDPVLSSSRIKARVLSRNLIADQMLLVTLEPNIHWHGFVPGQYVPLRVQIEGVWHERCYSPVSNPDHHKLQLVIKRHAHGRVSNWIHDHLREGDLVELGTAAGQFTLTKGESKPLLLIAGGSGITAIISLFEAALRQNPERSITLAYYAEHYGQMAFLETLQTLAATHQNAQLQLCVATEPRNDLDLQGRFSRQQLKGYCPDYARRICYVCGPAGLMQAVEHEYQQLNRMDQIYLEQFTLQHAPHSHHEKVRLNFARSQLQIESSQPTLLLAAESAGLKPKSACRMGICNTCSCTRISGKTRDLVTGLIDDTPQKVIRPCISEALSDVTLDL